MANIYDWSKTAGSNDAADGGINWLEGQAPSTVNNSARQMMGRLAEFRDDISGALATTNAGNAYSLTANSAFTTLASGRVVSFRASATNTGAATLNVNGIGSKAIRALRPSGDADIGSGIILNGQTHIVYYNESANGGAGAWVLVNPAAAASNTLSLFDFGAKGDCILLPDGAITSGTTAFTSATANFTNADVGKIIRIQGAGVAGGVLETTIAARVSSTAVTTTVAASTTVSGRPTYYGSDETAAIQAAINSTLGFNNPVRLVVPALIFMTTSALTVPQFTSLAMTGKGGSTPSIGAVIMPSVSIDGIVVTCSDPVYLADFGIIYAGPAASGKAGLKFSPPALKQNFFSVVRNLTIQNAYNGIIANEIVYGFFDGNRIIDYSNFGIVRTSALGSPVGDSGDNKFVNNQIQSFLAAPPSAGFYWSGGGGDTIMNNKFLLGQYGVHINPAINTNTSQLNITGNSFDGMMTAGVRFARQDATSTITQIVINSNTFNMWQGTPETISFAPEAGVGVSSVTITGNTFLGPPAANTQIHLFSVDNVIISGNAFKSQNAGTNSVIVGALATNAVTSGNSYSGTFSVGGTDDPVWTTFTPTISSGSGTITTKSATGRYFSIGKKVFFHITVTITTNGTGAGYVQVSGLPVAVANADQPAYGRNTSSTAMVQGILNVGATTLFLVKYDGSYPVAADPTTLIVSGFYESA